MSPTEFICKWPLNLAKKRTPSHHWTAWKTSIESLKLEVPKLTPSMSARNTAQWPASLSLPAKTPNTWSKPTGNFVCIFVSPHSSPSISLCARQVSLHPGKTLLRLHVWAVADWNCSSASVFLLRLSVPVVVVRLEDSNQWLRGWKSWDLRSGKVHKLRTVTNTKLEFGE